MLSGVFEEDGMRFSRRGFLATLTLGSLAVGLEAQEEKTKDGRRAETKTAALKRPIIICAANGLNYLDPAFEMLRGGADTLEAAMRVVAGPENDPNDTSVGLGGLPNLPVALDSGQIQLAIAALRSLRGWAGPGLIAAYNRLSAITIFRR